MVMPFQRPAIYTHAEIMARVQELGEAVIASSTVTADDVMDAINDVHAPLPPLDALALGVLLQAAGNGQYFVFYRHLTNMTTHCVTCDCLEEAQLVWDTFYYLRNSYTMTSSRPVARTPNNVANVA